MPSGRRHYRVTLADALTAHDQALRIGGRGGIRSIDEVLSNIARAYSGYYLRIEKKAAALFHGVATGHGFVDGNKRTAIFLTYLLLEKSGYTLEPIDASEKLEHVIDDFAVAVVERKHSFDEVVAWFKARIRKVDP